MTSEAAKLRKEYAGLSLPLGSTYEAAKHERDTGLFYIDRILALRSAAPALDEARLARAFHASAVGCYEFAHWDTTGEGDPDDHLVDAASVAVEYAALAALRSTAPALDVERLARALLAWGGALHEAGVVTLDEGGLVAANAIAREYAALRSPQPPEAGL